MKRILIALAVLLSVQVADAQVKTAEAVKKSVEAAELAAQNPKKATKVATWLKLAESYVSAYTNPAGAGWLGASAQELQFLMAGVKPKSVENVMLNGDPCVKEVYNRVDYYYNQAGLLVLIDVTKPIYEDALASALDAYSKAYEVDVNQTKVKEISAGIADVTKKYLDEGMNKYILGDAKAAGQLFEKAALASEVAPYSTPDTTAFYNAGFTAWVDQDYEKAKKYLEKCVEIGYYYEGGEVFAKLGDTYLKLGESQKAVETLENGFMKFPQSQSLLIGLINFYLESGENADRLFVLIGEAKKNEPNNASLYYVEGNIHKQLGNNDAAIASYNECAKVDPTYDFAYYGTGVLYYDQAVELSAKASAELDDNKYRVLQDQCAEALKKAMEPFEKAYEVSKNDALKRNTAEYLKNIYYRFSSEDNYMELYKKYDAIVKGL